MCEYAHSMGNSTGNLMEYWNLIYSKKNLMGGFIWDWIDQGIARIDAKGRKWWAYGGDYGDQPNDANFCINGLISPDRTVKGATEECKYVFQPVTVKPVDLAKMQFIIMNITLSVCPQIYCPNILPLHASPFNFLHESISKALSSHALLHNYRNDTAILHLRIQLNQRMSKDMFIFK